jgi:DNA polymerase-1
VPYIETDSLEPGKPHPLAHQLYNGLDCCLTLEIFNSIRQQNNQDPQVYDFARAMQAPALEMMLRGFKIDQYERAKGQDLLREKIVRYQDLLNTLAAAVWGKGLNPRSPLQLQQFFYQALGIPEQWISQKGEKKLSMNREALEKIELYMHARPVVTCILAIRDFAKELETLTAEVDPDGRMRTSYNIVGTETGRWSSSQSATGTGLNAQNVKRKLRKMFVADKGWKLCGIDLEQAESREVGWLCGILFNEWSYLDACLSGDLHTTTCRLIWPDLPWTGDIKKDKPIAEQIFYREYSYRDMSKRGGHGSNYYGTPYTMARHLKVTKKLMEDFQLNYFTAFPGIPKYHQWTAQQLQTVHKITTVFGRERHFFGRPNDDTTLREAIAFSPQSATGDRLNLALYRIWSKMRGRIRVLAQVHDALYFLFREDDNEAEVVSEALGYIDTPILDLKSGRKYTVPGEAKTGWNWADYDEKNNPDGLKKFKGEDTRKRLTEFERVL